MESLNPYLEYVLLHPDLKDKEVDEAIAYTRENNLAGLCLPPFWIKKAHRDLSGHSAQLIAAVGYPFGFQMTETKIQEIAQAIAQGADGIEVALNISAFKSGMPWVKIELAKCAQLIHSGGKMMSVGLNCDYLHPGEIQDLAKASKDAGTDFITLLDPPMDASFIEGIQIRLSDSVGVKVYSPITDHAWCRTLIHLGVERVGAPELASLKLVE